MYKAFLLSALVICAWSISANGQLVEIESPKKDKSTLDIGFDYRSNYDFYGIFNNFNSQPNSSPSISYSALNGLSLSATGLFISNSNAASSSKTTSEYDLAGGWDFILLNKALTISPSYTHFFFSSGVATAKSMYTDQAELDLSCSFKWFRPSVTADYLSGIKNALNLNINSGFNMKWNNVFTRGNSLEFEPEIGANYGNLSYSGLLARKLLVVLLPLKVKYGDNITIQQLEANGAIAKKSALRKQLAILKPSATLGEIFTPIYNDQVNSVYLNFPLTYTIKNLTLYSELNISKPMNVPVYMISQAVVFFSAGISYSFKL